MDLIVSKFGGTSMGDATCMLRSAEVSFIRGSFLIVVSATSGTTNQLLSLGQAAQAGQWEVCEELIRKIETRHQALGRELKIVDLHA